MGTHVPVVAVIIAAVVGGVVAVIAGAQTVLAQTALAQTVLAQTVEQEPVGSSRLVAVLDGPGGVGYWLVSEDGSVEVVGTTILPALGDDPEIPVRVESARAGSPGALGLWLILADGTEVAVGDPGPEVDLRERRSLGWLAGTSVRQLMRGAWWPDIDLACTGELPRAVRIGQTLMTALTEREFGLAVEEARDHQIGGIMLLGGATPFIDRRIAELQEFSGRIPMMMAVDEEGGRVQRLRGVLPNLSSAASQAADRVDVVEARAVRHGDDMSDLGFTVNFAPVLDVGAGPGIGDRSYGNDPGVVSTYGLAVASGLADAGILPVVKHFPGHGGATADSHVELPQTAPLAELRERDLLPFIDAVQSAEVAVMVGHLMVPDLTRGLPASLSSAAIDGLLRGELGHNGLVVTDSLVMKAISDRWTVPEAVVLSLAAGADLALIGNLDDVPAAFDEIDRAVQEGRLSVEALDRAATHVLRAKGLNACTLVGRVRGNLNTVRDR
ncbi:MAG: glycoside hydrolase family 3 N-terminal domain-containing protein [Actinomycetota bacterium]|jgi:beta-N-acetylhexosaminidase|nr:glycoside hydrolase family 3 N-terminal domain-containing protein [Actinomycetota bacterium]